MTEYTCYEVKGFYKYHSFEVVEHNLLEVLKKTNYRAYTTKDFFNRVFIGNTYFEVVYCGDNLPNMAYIKEKIAKDKLVIFPVSSVVYMDEIFRYLELGFTVWFMRAKDYKQFKKDYAMSM
jgi:hypothetical protein